MSTRLVMSRTENRMPATAAARGVVRRAWPKGVSDCIASTPPGSGSIGRPRRSPFWSAASLTAPQGLRLIPFDGLAEAVHNCCESNLLLFGDCAQVCFHKDAHLNRCTAQQLLDAGCIVLGRKIIQDCLRWGRQKRPRGRIFAMTPASSSIWRTGMIMRVNMKRTLRLPSSSCSFSIISALGTSRSVVARQVEQHCFHRLNAGLHLAQ